MKFVTVATHKDGYFDFLLQSCVRHHVDLEVLGWGMKWGGWVWRLNLIRDYYKSLDPNEIVCFIDAYDVLILQDSTEIEKLFLDTGARIVVAQDFNTESYREFIARIFLFGTCKRVRINAGTYIGYAEDILWVIETMCIQHNCVNNDSLDDQRMMTQLCIVYPEKFHIDTNRDIFLTLCYRNGMRMAGIHVDEEKKQLVYKEHIYPCILHGAGKAHMDDIIKAMGYDITVSATPPGVVYEIYMRQVMLSLISVVVILILSFTMCYIYKRCFGSVHRR